MKKFYIILGFMCLLSLGCAGEYSRPEEIKVITVKKAKTVDVYFKALKADMIIAGGGKDLMIGKFSYFMPTNRTVVDYHERGETGSLDIYDKFFPAIGVYPNEKRMNLWKVILGNAVPFTGRVNLSQGSFQFDAADINIHRMELEFGRVNGDINLSKVWKESFYASVHLEDGELIFRIPSNMGAMIELEEEGLNVKVEGFKKEGLILTNDHYKKENSVIRLYIHSGHGQIKILTESVK